MQINKIAAAAALLVSGLASATIVYDAGSYSVIYDETTTFGFISSWTSVGNSVGFEWSVSTDVSLVNNGGSVAPASFALPSFTLVANPGYALAGTLVASLGNIAYAEFNGSTAIDVNATLKLNNGADWVLPTAALTKVANNPFQGYFAGSSSLSLAGITSLEVKDGSITLSASDGSFAAIGGQPQNKFSFAFEAAPVPEPQSYVLLLAGLGMIGLLARRRRQPR